MAIQESPIVSTAVSPPPIIAVANSPAPVLKPLPPAKPFMVDVSISGDGRVLWRGPLRIAYGWGANVTQTASQAPPAICPGLSRYEGDYRDMIAFHIRAGESAGETVNISVNWQRPVTDWSCANAGLRTVQITQSVKLIPGKAVTLQGDAGLKFTITRR